MGVVDGCDRQKTIEKLHLRGQHLRPVIPLGAVDFGKVLPSTASRWPFDQPPLVARHRRLILCREFGDGDRLTVEEESQQ